MHRAYRFLSRSRNLAAIFDLGPAHDRATRPCAAGIEEDATLSASSTPTRPVERLTARPRRHRSASKRLRQGSDASERRRKAYGKGAALAHSVEELTEREFCPAIASKSFAGRKKCQREARKSLRQGSRCSSQAKKSLRQGSRCSSSAKKSLREAFVADEQLDMGFRKLFRATRRQIFLPVSFFALLAGKFSFP